MQRLEDRYINWYLKTHASKAELAKWSVVLDELLEGFYAYIGGCNDSRYAVNVAAKFMERERSCR